MMKATGFDLLRQALRVLGSRRESGKFDLVLGPCAVESEEQINACAEAVSKCGATYLRGGAIKLRTQVDTFHGIGREAWRMLRAAADAHGLKAVSEVTRPEDIEYASRSLDALQIGARSMWHFDLLEAAAKSGRPVVLKRGLGSSTTDWLAAAVRLKSYGCDDVILCERGDRAADVGPRNAIDISTLIFLASEGPLPLWLDVSHSAGDPAVALRLLQLAPSLGVAGVMAETHPNPADALCDADQAIPLILLQNQTRDEDG